MKAKLRTLLTPLACAAVAAGAQAALVGDDCTTECTPAQTTQLATRTKALQPGGAGVYFVRSSAEPQTECPPEATDAARAVTQVTRQNVNAPAQASLTTTACDCDCACCGAGCTKAITNIDGGTWVASSAPHSFVWKAKGGNVATHPTLMTLNDASGTLAPATTYESYVALNQDSSSQEHRVFVNSNVTARDGKKIEVSIVETDDKRIIRVNGKEIGKDRIREQDGKIIILDQNGEEIIELKLQGRADGNTIRSNGQFLTLNDGNTEARGVARLLLKHDDEELNLKTFSKPRVMIGITMGQVEQTDANQGVQGVAVMDVIEGLPAERAGVKSGDIILALNGEPTVTPEIIQRQVAKLKPGQDVKVRLLRGDDRITRTVTVQEYNSDSFFPGITEENVEIGFAPMIKEGEFSFEFDPSMLNIDPRQLDIEVEDLYRLRDLPVTLNRLGDDLHERIKKAVESALKDTDVGTELRRKIHEHIQQALKEHGHISDAFGQPIQVEILRDRAKGEARALVMPDVRLDREHVNVEARVRQVPRAQVRTDDPRRRSVIVKVEEDEVGENRETDGDSVAKRLERLEERLVRLERLLRQLVEDR